MDEVDIEQQYVAPLVAALQRRGSLKDPRVASAFAAVPRHHFIPDAPLSDVYAVDTSIPLAYDAESGAVLRSSIQPSMVAQMLDQLALQAGQNVLEIGTGTGYTAALARQLVGEGGTVTSLELDRQTAQFAEDTLQSLGMSGVRVVNQDGALGYAPRAQYDRILSTVGVWDVPPAWIRQLKPQGRLVIPMWIDGLQVVAAFTHGPDGTLESEQVTPGKFVYMQGEARGPDVRRRIGSTSLTILADGVRSVDTAALHLLLTHDPEATFLTQALNSFDYWYGFVPFVMIHEPDKYVFALYTITGTDTAYGLSGEGFALIGRSSACFVPYYGLNNAHSFGSADAYMEIETLLKQWAEAGNPGLADVHLRLIPKSADAPAITRGKLYPRRDHYLHVWQQHHDDDHA